MGGRGELPQVLSERLGRLGHRVRCSEADDAVVDLNADLLVLLDTARGEPAKPVETGDTLSRASAALDVVKRATASMKTRAFGRIVHVRSVPPASSADSLSMSAFTSAGALGMLQELARQLARFGITINMVTLTPAPAGDPSRPPLRREATVTDVAALIEMLCHDEAGFMTAQCLPLISNVS
jgi:acyl carrier protein